MPSTRKLQVFVSSTYADLKEQRQAAVEAILTAGHIPAGMELFTAGDQSQMEVIRRWIDESDVFLLILGGRYGSLEPTTGKSYTQLEYEYAIEKGKPLFAVVVNEAVIEERVKSAGISVIEIENAAQLREFRQLVLSKMVRFWSDVRDIKLAVLERLGELNRRSDLIGWVPGDQAVSGSFLAEEIARLTSENSELRKRLITSGAGEQTTINGLSYEELRELLQRDIVDASDFSAEEAAKLQEAANKLGHSSINLVTLLWRVQNQRFERLPVRVERNAPPIRYYQRLQFYGLIEFEGYTNDSYAVYLTSDGKKFVLRLMTKLQ
jgi:Domain of unknown function (DUF4062)